ncbi:hypothetical protein GGI15_000182 [Coemansia interrupta]|uniref:Uncharacterized protein n=1 Tax=Coemansia interrupta TaxID=1126814 RepID=A0A9W8LNS5_9FUNG|nr:hypothetical protein GGI15_000182 [Coemansia interrupta]
MSSEITSCMQISERQQRLLMQCYCKKELNTLFLKYYKYSGEVVCTRMDRHMYRRNATEICINHRKYRCTGVNVNAGPTPVSAIKMVIVWILLATCLIS